MSIDTGVDGRPVTVVERSRGLAVERITRTYHSREREVLALDDVSVDLDAGGFLAVVGPSGCGKSTLLRMLAGLDDPDSGVISFRGQTPLRLCHDHRLGVAFQNPGLMPWRTTEGNIKLAFQVAGRKPPAGRLAELIELVGLTGFEKARPHQLSGGMQQRVALARALALEPDLLLLDEPFGALDAITRTGLNLALLEISERLKTTTILITHSVPEAVFLANKVMVLSPRPGRVTSIVDVDFPHPRANTLMSDPEFHRACDHVTAMLGQTGHT
jgi:NitT/TauT family transport system ATP-binding protein